MNKRSFLLVAVVAIAVALVLGLRSFSAKVPQAEGRSADETTTAEALFTAFNSDEAAANARYNDKVVRVSGVVRSVQPAGDGRTTVTLETGDALGAVVCEFAAGADHGCTPGASVTLQGFCSGFNLDVLLQRCSAVPNAS